MRIKKLEWVKDIVTHTETNIQQYLIKTEIIRGFNLPVDSVYVLYAWFPHQPRPNWIGDFVTLERAKEAAQTHYEKLISGHLEDED